jgi:hypothetical protein
VENKKIEVVQELNSRVRKMCKVVCRESNVMLDPPLMSVDIDVNHKSNNDLMNHHHHPALLTPLAASRDACMKVLQALRSLLRTEGQAMLLKDPETDPLTYQVIYSGNAIYWPGVEQSVFGIVSSSTSLSKSLVETVMNTRKTLQTSNAPIDQRYNSYIDGICVLGTPLLLTPLRGRGGSVVGVLMAAKSIEDNKEFLEEDVIAIELLSSFASLSLYWCHGLATLHVQLNKKNNKINQLEKIIKKGIQ